MFIAFVVAAALLSGCASSRGGTIPYNVSDFGQPDPIASTTIGHDYHIAPLDKLEVTVFQVPELSGEYSVDLTGQLSMPLIGSVRAVDLTTDQLKEQLVAHYSQTYLKDPFITVGIVEAGGSKITIEGSVSRPGLFPIYGPTSLLQAVAMAGGPDDDANPKRVAVFRQIDGQRMAAAFDLTTIRAGEDDDPAIYRGDIIVVDGSKARQRFRDVLSSLPLARFFVPIF